VPLIQIRVSSCTSLIAIAFETSSKLAQIKELAFATSGLTPLRIPASLEMLGRLCFVEGRPLPSIAFEFSSKLPEVAANCFLSLLRLGHMKFSRSAWFIC
jgi:hypothetical protein